MNLVTPGFRTLVVCAAMAPAVSSPLAAQGHFADLVVAANDNGQLGGGIFNPSNALGAPQGGSHVHSLGNAGSLTLGFTLPITDGPGADLIVSENPFTSLSGFWLSFAEVCFVEVSSNGVDFVRFPSHYYGPPTSPGSFGFLPIGTYAGLAGQSPVFAMDPGIDPRDVASAGGDAFDLADLAAEPLVLSGTVDLTAITHVRMVDVLNGVSTDTTGTTIYDTGTGSADIDAVTAVHQQGQVPAGNPEVALNVLSDGTMTLRIADPDGWQDLDPASLNAMLFGLPVDAGGLLSAFFVSSIDADGFDLVQPFPLPQDLLFTISLSLKDAAGHRSGQTRVRPGS